MEPTIKAQIERVLERLEEQRTELGRGRGGRELSLTITKAEEMLMWFEKSVREIAAGVGR